MKLQWRVLENDTARVHQKDGTNLTECPDEIDLWRYYDTSSTTTVSFLIIYLE